MILILPFVAIIVGAVLGLFLDQPLTGTSGQYLAVACLAGLDSVCGGLRSGLEGKFHNDVFITGFFSNIIIAFFLAWLGDRLYIDLFLGVGLVLGARIFTNLSLIRRFLLTKLQDARERQRLQQAQKQSVGAEPSGNIA
jgi:small basic protein